MKVTSRLAVGVLSVAALCATPLAHGAGDDGISPGDFERYQRRQELALEREQAMHAERSAPESPEAVRAQRRRFEAERVRQRQLLERQRRRVAAERARLHPAPRSGSSREIVVQQLRREQASERLSRKLLR